MRKCEIVSETVVFRERETVTMHDHGHQHGRYRVDTVRCQCLTHNMPVEHYPGMKSDGLLCPIGRIEAAAVEASQQIDERVRILIGLSGEMEAMVRALMELARK